VLLHNSVNVMSKPNGGHPGSANLAAAQPLFTHRETDNSAQHWQDCGLRQPWSLEGERLARPEEADVSFELFDAGHILGSTGILIHAEGRRIFYSGDVNFLDQTVSRAAAFPEDGVDVLIMETTRGDHPLAPGFQRAAEETRFVETLRQVFARDGAALIPVFALGKTQEVLAMFLQYKQRGLLGDVPVYIGGLSTKMTEVYDRFAASTPRRLQGLSLLHSVAPYVLSGREAGSSPIKPRRIYALSSGMMTEHTLSNVFARRMLADPRHAILFVGYADPESPAGRLRAAAPGELVCLSDDAPPVERRCQLEVFDFSAHSQRDDILSYIRRLKPKKVVLVHGDPPAIAWFQKTLAKAEPEMEVIVPPPGVAVEL
jgi:Cft2 family RNA processing exonuclease